MSRDAVFDAIVRRENEQLPRADNLYEVSMLTQKDPRVYGRWFLGRNNEGKSIIRPRRAGLNPIFHDHSMNDDIYITEPNFKNYIRFQYSTDRPHIILRNPINTYR